MNLLTFLLLSLAAWRIASLLAREDGPGDVFMRLRRLLGVKYIYNERSELVKAVGSNVVAKAIICVWCLSVWIGTGMAVFYYLAPDWALWLSLPLAFSAAAIVVERYTHGD